MKSIQVEDDILDDLKLVKRVLGTKNMTETIRRIMNSANFNEKWMEAMSALLKREEARKDE
jgi:predicted urease superfamily metal-dependent hydrolase